MSKAAAVVKFHNLGINDKSTEAKSVFPEDVAQFTPLFPLFTEKGPEELQVINADSFIDIYGPKTIDTQSPYFTHQTALLVECIRKGISTIGVKRIIPVGALSGSLTVGVDSTFPDSWFVGNIFYVKTDNTYTPIMDFDTSSVGKWGNEYGVIIEPANLLETLRVGLMDDSKVYKFTLVSYDTLTNRTAPIPNKFGELATYFTLNPNATSHSGVKYFFNDIIHSSYINVVDNNTSNRVLAKARFYPTNFKKLVEASPRYDSSVPYWNQDLNKIFNHELIGSPIFDGTMPMVFTGGYDGDLGGKGSFVEQALAKLKLYDDSVYAFLTSLTQVSPYVDAAKYPYSTFIDTGFSFKTKIAAATLLNSRGDCWALIGTYSEADYVTGSDGRERYVMVPKQTEQQRQAVATRILSAFRLYPESNWFGTPACRVVLMKNTGVSENTNISRVQSITTYLAGILCPFMGSPDGSWRERHAPDSEENRIIRGWKDIDVGYQSPTSRLMDATNTVTAVENFDHKHKYIPVYRTIYNDPTSVLSDMFTMLAGCYIARVGEEAWRQFVNVRLPGSKRAEVVAEYILKRCENKFNGRYLIVPRVGKDERGEVIERVVVELHSTVAKTTATFNIDSHRRAE